MIESRLVISEIVESSDAIVVKFLRMSRTDTRHSCKELTKKRGKIILTNRLYLISLTILTQQHKHLNPPPRCFIFDPAHLHKLSNILPTENPAQPTENPIPTHIESSPTPRESSPTPRGSSPTHRESSLYLIHPEVDRLHCVIATAGE